MSQQNLPGSPPPLGINQRQTSHEDSAPSIPSFSGASSLGAMLRDARQKQGLSAADLASSLNLDLVVVEAIENNRLDEAPEPLYVRAYLKHWAGMMNTNPAPWIAALDAQTHDRSPSHRVSARTPVDAVRPSRARGIQRRSGVVGLIWRLLVVGILLGAAVALLALALPSFWQKVTQWLPHHDRAASADSALALPVTALPAPTPTEPTAPAASLPLPPPPTLATPANPEPSPIDAATTAPAVAAPVSPAPSPAAEPVAPMPADASAAPAKSEAPTNATTAPSADTPHNPLKIAVTKADCWVEVRDATGKRLIYDVLKKGSERSLNGKAPFTVVLGHADGVEVTWQGKPVTLGTPNSTTGIIRTTVGGS
ncbi:RodZ domain-containing protein [Halothiobacillus sp. DCM-1]|uniref:helix-turn-helix domain-containing protein n=1 Tax=Halothiobacillus sp. DCM-1 TaxID=3112558 RepID=UPI0032452FCB